jgi:hypothetical protein
MRTLLGPIGGNNPYGSDICAKIAYIRKLTNRKQLIVLSAPFFDLIKLKRKRDAGTNAIATNT